MFRLVQISTASTEQYGVFLGDQKLDRAGLRCGFFSANYIDYDGEQVYSADIRFSEFTNEHERDHHLRKALKALWKYHVTSYTIEKPHG